MIILATTISSLLFEIVAGLFSCTLRPRPTSPTGLIWSPAHPMWRNMGWLWWMESSRLLNWSMISREVCSLWASFTHSCCAWTLLTSRFVSFKVLFKCFWRKRVFTVCRFYRSSTTTCLWLSPSRFLMTSLLMCTCLWISSWLRSAWPCLRNTANATLHSSPMRHCIRFEKDEIIKVILWNQPCLFCVCTQKKSAFHSYLGSVLTYSCHVY